jgi:hypothetical protein
MKDENEQIEKPSISNSINDNPDKKDKKAA